MGRYVGAHVGKNVGKDVGTAVGSAVGTSVGAAVGPAVVRPGRKGRSSSTFAITSADSGTFFSRHEPQLFGQLA